MHVAALLPYPYDTVPSQRFRLEQWEPELARHGITLSRQHLFADQSILEGLWQRPPRWRALARLVEASARRLARVILDTPPDGVIVHREASLLGPPLLEALISLRTPLILDLDDAVWLRGRAFGPWSLASLARMPAKANWTMRMCAAVSAGNEYIAEHARRICSRVAIVPTTVDTAATYIKLKRHTATHPVVVGWSGSRSTVGYLEQLLPTLECIAANVDIRLLVIGADIKRPTRLSIECRPWRAQTEVADLLDIDIGVMPLPDDSWARGKCGLKILQYMALGIPAVVSPVGVNRAMVSHGVTGFLAQGIAQWRDAIVALKDPILRTRMGTAARSTVIARYSAQVGASALASLLATVPRRR